MAADSSALVGRKKLFTKQLDSSVVADAHCFVIAEQLERDKTAIKRQQQTNEMGVAEIDAWRKANEEALKEAAMDGAKFGLSRMATALEKREAAATAYKGWLTRYQKQLNAKKIPYAMLEDKIDRAVNGYATAKTAVAAGKVTAKTMEASDIFDNYKIQAELVARGSASADALLRAALEDPSWQKFVHSDPKAWELLRSTLDVASSSTELAKLSPHYALAALIVDGSYDATKWTLSRNRIMQQYNMSDTRLLAVASLQRQIEKTVQKLKECRAE